MNIIGLDWTVIDMNIKKKMKKFEYSIQKRIGLIGNLIWERDDKIVLFGSWAGNRFACNSRYLFQYLAEHKEKLGLSHVVWVTRSKKICMNLRDMGYEAYEMDSKESIYYHKHAGYHIVCNDQFKDMYGIYSLGAKCINLWHGLPLKSFGYAGNDYKKSGKSMNLNKKYIKKPWDEMFLLTTTEHATKMLDKCMKLEYKYYIHSGYPRNCEVVRLTEEEEKILDILKCYDSSVLYLPTFRTGDNVFDFALYGEILSETLAKNKILWIQKAHSVDKQNKIKSGLNGNVLTLTPEFDINVLLPHITLLSTDYSSVMFDAMYHYKPVLYLVPDIEEYKNGDRGLNLVNPFDVMCGPIFMSIDDLKNDLANYCKNPEKAKDDKYLKIRELYWGNKKVSLENIWYDIVEATTK